MLHREEQKRVSIVEDEEGPNHQTAPVVVLLVPQDEEKKKTINEHQQQIYNQDDDDGDDEFAHIITEGLPPEIARVALELAKQVESLGKHLTEEDVEETSHRNDPLYREFLKAGARPNSKTGEMQISLVQFHKHLRNGRGLTATEKLQGIVDEDYDFFRHRAANPPSSRTENQKMNQKSNVHVGRNTSDYFYQPTTAAGDYDIKNNNNGNQFVSSAAQNNNRSVTMATSQVATRSLADYEKVMMTMSECYLSFNQVSALIRHNTSGPQQRKTRTSFLSKLVEKNLSSSAVVGASFSNPDSSTILNNTNNSRENENNSSNNETEPERCVSTQFLSNSGFFNVSHTSHVGTSEGGGDVQNQSTSNRSNQQNNPNNNNTFENSSALPTPKSDAENGKQKSASVINENNYQQQSSSVASVASPQPATGDHHANATHHNQKRQDESFRSDEDGDDDDEEDQVENEFFASDLKKKSQYVSKYDKMMAKVERISHSPQRVHGGKSSDSVVPNYLIPKRQIELQKRREKIERMREETTASRERRRSDASQQQHQQQLHQESSQPFSSQAGSAPLSPMFSTSDFSKEPSNNYDQQQQQQNPTNIDPQLQQPPSAPVKAGFGFLDGNSKYKSKVETTHKLPDRPTFSPRSHRAVSPQERYEAFVAYSSQKRNREKNKPPTTPAAAQQQKINQPPPPQQNPRSKRVLAVQEQQRKLQEEEERKKRAAVAPPLSFSYYKWMQSQRRTLPISAHEAGFVSQDETLSEEINNNSNDNKQRETPIPTKPYYSASYYEHQEHPEKFTRPLSRSGNQEENNNDGECDEENANPNEGSRPQSATSKTRHLSFVSHRSNANWIKLKNKNVGFGMPPPLNREHFPQFRHRKNNNNNDMNDDHHHHQQDENNNNNNNRKQPSRPTSATRNSSYQPHAGQSAIVVSSDTSHKQRQLQQEMFDRFLQNQDIPSIALIPEKHNFVFAKLSSRGPSYLVRPEYAQEQEEKRKQLAAENRKKEQSRRKQDRDISFAASSASATRKKEGDQDDDCFVEVDEDNSDDDENNDDDHVESFFQGGNKSANREEAPSWENSRSKHPSFSTTQTQQKQERRKSTINVTQQNQMLANSIMLMEKDEQSRVRDDDTTANGLATMMRAHIATRTIQRWFRVLYYMKREFCAKYIQRIGRGFARGRKEVAKILIPVEDNNNNKKKFITRTQFCVERLQRVGRGFIHARKRLANQYDHETFDRNIGRFAALLGIRSCLSHFGNNSQPMMLGKENRSLTFDDIPMVSATEEYSNNQNNTSAPSPSSMSPKTSFKQPNINNNSGAMKRNDSKLQSFSSATAGGSFALSNSTPSYRQKQEQIQKTHYHSLDRPPEDVRLKYALFASEEKRTQQQYDDEVEVQENNGTEEERRISNAADDDEEVDFDSKNEASSPAVSRTKQQQPYSPFFTGRRHSPHRNQAEYEKLLEREQMEESARENAEQRKNLKWHPPSRIKKVLKDFCDPNGAGDVEILAKFI